MITSDPLRLEDFFRQEFVKLAQRGKDGFAIVDRAFRYIHVNERMAAFNGTSVEEQIGRTIQRVNPWTASVLEPFLARVIESGKPVIDSVAQVANLSKGEIPELGYWLINCYPLMSGD